MSEVFLSHASADDAIVAELRRRLAAQGAPTWVDSRSLRAGDALADLDSRDVAELRLLLESFKEETPPAAASE